MSEKEKQPLTIYVDEQTKSEYSDLLKSEKSRKRMAFGGELFKKGIQLFKAEKIEEQI